MLDFVLPKGNESSFTDIAPKLDFKALCFVYPVEELPSQKAQSEKIKIYHAALVRTAKQAATAQKVADIVLARATKNLREQLERWPVDIIFGLESIAQREPLFYRASGLDHVLCKIAARKGITFMLDFSQFLTARPFKRAVLLGRAAQNITLCTKYNVALVIASLATKPSYMRAARDLASLCVCLGMRPEKAKLAISGKLFKWPEH